MNVPRLLSRILSLLPLGALSACLYPAGVSVGIGGGFGGGHSHIGIGTAVTIPVIHSRNTEVYWSDDDPTQQIVAYFDADGNVLSRPVAGGYRRVVLGSAGGGEFWVQDFYIGSNRRYSEPMRLPPDRFRTFRAVPPQEHFVRYCEGGVCTQTTYRTDNGYNTVRRPPYPYYPDRRPPQRTIDPRRLVGLSPSQRQQLLRANGITQEPDTSNLHLTPTERLQLMNRNQAAMQGVRQPNTIRRPPVPPRRPYPYGY